MYEPKKGQTLYILSPEDGDRIDHLLGVLSMAVAELLAAKRVTIPNTPECLPAEAQLQDEQNEISKEATKSEDYDF